MIYRQREEFSLDRLNQMQCYLAEETIDDYRAGHMSRRRMLRRLIYICGSSAAAMSLLAACGDSTATNVPATSTATTTIATTTTAATTTTSVAATTAVAVKSPLSVAANDPAVDTSEVTFQSDTQMFGYLAKPKASGTYPGIIVIHENRGLTDHIRDVARRLAKAGYIALAPDLVSRAGGTGKLSADQIPGFLSQAKIEDLVKDLNAGVTFLEKQQGVKADKLGVVGFCFGGSYTLQLAAANPKILAAVPYYGVTPNPASIMSKTNAAILGNYGATDTRVDSTIPDLEKVMKDNGKIYEKKLYDGAGHAFNNDTGASYNEPAALAAWQATLDWFGKYLK
ncbi:MAG: dienelactone hydrolase family protein [Chloroflexi bacterium]|uniref:Dienelactone hydrolase family protein n=1 Tax=Candidatus Chlorohelix allophototropha TaxID=3003348 RepID=A0A8T7LXC4_9CHLR|nr:dienelactone hydrolase family protein [Chloroflexota bacterium]WJW65983.1 dienelactone hydrolase family protein [Chloroflexota bacterium L227-S17]